MRVLLARPKIIERLKMKTNEKFTDMTCGVVRIIYNVFKSEDKYFLQEGSTRDGSDKTTAWDQTLIECRKAHNTEPSDYENIFLEGKKLRLCKVKR